MRHRLAALPFLALIFGAIDTLLVRWSHDHRALDAALFWQACLLWLAYGVIALVPATLVPWWRRRKRSDAAPHTANDEVLGLAAWTGGPVLLHARLNQYTGIGGDLSGLLSFGALFGVLLTVLVLFVVIALTRFLLSRAGALRLGVGLALASVALGLLVSFHEDTGGAHADLATEAASEDGKRPNVLLLVCDTTRARSLSLHGYRRERQGGEPASTTPNLDRLASDALVFENARSVSSYTFTSHLSMLTGVYPSHHGARLVRQTFNPYETPTVVEDFRRAGYRTGAFVGTGVLRAQTGFAWAFEEYDDQVDPPVCDTFAWAVLHDVQSVAAEFIPFFHNNGLPHWIQDFQRPAEEVLANAAAWIDEPDPRPWFCLVNLYDVHWPYVPSEQARAEWVEPYDGPVDGYLKRSDHFAQHKEALRENPELLEQGKEHVKQLYDAEMWELDQKVDAFLGGLDLEQTALLMTSDHGEAFGEQGRWEHDDILESQLRVPFLVRPAGGVPGGRRIDWPVSGIDVGPTLLSLGGVAPFTGRASDENLLRFLGADLLKVAEDPPAPRAILVEDRDHLDRKDIRLAFYEEHWKLVRLGFEDEIEWQLFDLAADPAGRDDVAEEHPQVVERLSGRLDELRAVWGVSDREDSQAGVNANADALKALGYTDS
jgi:arylsulfatase A-like enzyme